MASDFYLKFIGNHLIYIGKAQGSCTGNPEFFSDTIGKLGSSKLKRNTKLVRYSF